MGAVSVGFLPIFSILKSDSLVIYQTSRAFRGLGKLLQYMLSLGGLKRWRQLSLVLTAHVVI